VAVVGMVVDLAAADAARLPDAKTATTVISGITVPRLAVAAGMAALTLVLAALRTNPD
jgi:HPr kinase/phosphorylase